MSAPCQCRVEYSDPDKVGPAPHQKLVIVHGPCHSVSDRLIQAEKEREKAVAHAMHFEKLVAQKAQLESRLAQAREAVRKYGQHLMGQETTCELKQGKIQSFTQCTCGLTAAREESA